LFVVFEGGEGAGKSTQSARLAALLRASGLDVVTTREPGGSPVGEAVRAVLLDTAHGGMSARAEALLFAAARGEHVHRVVRPALERGAVVVCDRYLDSSVAYQGVGRGLGADTVAGLSLWATEGLRPDLTVLLDVDPAVGLGRVGEPDRLEVEPPAFHRAVRAGFLALAAADPARYLVVDARSSARRVAEQVAARVDALLSDVPAVPDPT
jgi:dTMP kinase